MAAKKKGGAGGKLSRSEIVTVRLDPKLKFAAELAARKQRRTLSSLIEWTIEQSLKDIFVGEVIADETGNKVTVNALEAMSNVWDIYEPERFVKFAEKFPDLLNYREEILWKTICDNSRFWSYLDSRWIEKFDKHFDFKWDTTINNLAKDELNKYWDTLNEIADGKLSEDSIPKEKYEDMAKKTVPF